MDTDERLRLVRAVRDLCVQAALEAHEDAGISGLCHEGRWEVAIGAVRQLDPGQLLALCDAEPPAKD